MSRRGFIPLVGALSVLALACAGRAVEPEGAEKAPAAVAHLDERLAALTPAAPLAYFELGEEVASEMRDAAGVDLARRLYLLAYTLESPGSPMRASACIALAALADRERDRRQLLALAEAMRPDATVPGMNESVPPGPTAARPTTGESDAPAALATALGFYRSGEYGRAAPLLDRADVRALLERYSTPLDAIVREVKSRSSCRECHNQRAVRAEDAPMDGAPPPLRLCYTCSGNPGPNLDSQKFLTLLRVEAALLAGSGQSWSTQLLADQAAPLVELTPESLASLYSVDVTKTVFRDGAWVSP